ncbi:MAG: hypothetical protein KFB96_24635 [Thiocapsa sp.]|uniref:AbrB/MazE/SpoVT family DNA-binding domain-containing protein n=1 Tax=Thiocapsa sp. TaxID=2024551 RepID=UPI001BCCB102|nr:hypothetical protein [Thiocapsa sp.]QVL48708.1 MAG: hypothetical protein KFB96_24635 [Thiocapsa sp.]
MSKASAVRFEGIVQPWGNSLGLRITRSVSELANLKRGAHVTMEITDEGLLIRRQATEPRRPLPFSEATLLDGLTPFTAHADELPILIVSEQDH